MKEKTPNQPGWWSAAGAISDTWWRAWAGKVLGRRRGEGRRWEKWAPSSWGCEVFSIREQQEFSVGFAFTYVSDFLSRQQRTKGRAAVCG